MLGIGHEEIVLRRSTGGVTDIRRAVDGCIEGFHAQGRRSASVTVWTSGEGRDRWHTLTSTDL
jgi:hypothetical protein